MAAAPAPVTATLALVSPLIILVPDTKPDGRAVFEKSVLQALHSFMSPALFHYPHFMFDGCPINWAAWILNPRFATYYEQLVGHPCESFGTHPRGADWWARKVVEVFFITLVRNSLEHHYGSYEVQILLFAAKDAGAEWTQRFAELVADPRLVTEAAYRTRASEVLAYLKREGISTVRVILPRFDADMAKTRLELLYHNIWNDVRM